MHRSTRKVFSNLTRLIIGSASVLSLTTVAQANTESSGLEEVVVFGRVQAEENLQVPQSVDVIDAHLLENLSANSVGDALRFIPGASRDGSLLDAFGDTYLMHGFYSSQTVNGIGVNRLNNARDTVNVERIEVLKGPASVLYGQLQPGAVINIITKQPLRDPSFEASIEGSRYDQYRVTADLTGPLSADENLRGRITGAYEENDSFVDFWHKDHSFLSTALAYDFSERTSVSLEAFVTDTHWDGFHNGLPAEGTVLPNPNGTIPRNRSIVDPTWDGIDRSNAEITLRLNHQFAKDVAYRGVISWTKERVDGEELFGVLGWEDDTKRNLTRALLNSNVDGDAYLIYNDLSFSFATGSLTHNFVTGVDFTHSQRENDNDISLTTSIDLFTPEYQYDAKPEAFFIPDFSGVTKEDNDTYGVFLQDRIQLSDRLRLIVGTRLAGFDQQIDDLPDAGSATRNDQSPDKWTTQLGLLYMRSESLAFFMNRSTSFLPVQGTTTDGDALEPETGTQYEVGVKTALLDNRITATMALFELTRADVAVSDRDDPSALIPIGEQRARGLEASLRGRLTSNWHLYLAYGYTDAETTEDTNSVLVGKPIRNVPKNTWALATDYEITAGAMSGLGLGTAVNYMDERTGDTEGSFSLPDYWRVDLFTSYQINNHWQVRASVENLFNETYYDHAFSMFEVWPGAPRIYKVQIKTRF